jgi:hypothetical protein
LQNASTQYNLIQTKYDDDALVIAAMAIGADDAVVVFVATTIRPFRFCIRNDFLSVQVQVVMQRIFVARADIYISSLTRGTGSSTTSTIQYEAFSFTTTMTLLLQLGPMCS